VVDLEFVCFFAKTAHGEQKRKYTNDPYIVHPVSVANIVASVCFDPDVIAAALLHDVVEDTPVTLSELRAVFGVRIASFVSEVTDVSRPQDGNRAVRKKLDREHLAKASPQAQTIKLADLIDNTKSIVAHDPDFAKVYLQEKRALLEVLTMGHHILYDRAVDLVGTAEIALGLSV